MSCPPDQKKTPNQLAGLAIAAGMTPKSTPLAVAVAIALAESGGCPSAVSSTNDYGLWQVNIPAHPEYTADQMMDPNQNAAAMFKISSGGVNWRPWSTYNNGAYLGFLEAGKTGADTPVDPGVPDTGVGSASGGNAGDPGAAVPIDPIQNVYDSLKSLVSLVTLPIKAGQWVVKNIRRVIEGLLGVTAIVVGIVMINEDTFSGAASKIASAVPSGS